ncbi:phosphatidylinositol 4,5-bisphosphate 5-phosphatase A-like [Daphnia pulex]|uniref:phosphatidylinositol 4,5-bisphosphate 5-phosphatase A-like n=1 Tax=Daphnia pulex TaxID=6669 RepID=UPI001EDEF76E|nr:phosphatidylinositol 4,5-bisphosphate 5-phosphatase A-like [Daphnia pulex]XP_046645929.1 phosphatidylinositol 4,5-bisphosphate 5-phosphatase A-like [Daphnia pulicaria]
MTMDVLSIYLLTWNVVTVEPPPSDQLQSLLDSNADFIAIGLQEVKSQPQNLIADNLYEDSWTNSFRDVLAKHDYVKIHTVRLVGILLSFFAKKQHLLSIRNVETSYTRTGFNGLWGNKGAVSIRFNFKGSSVCLVNCHLSPHDKKLSNRIADYHSIINSQTFHKEKISLVIDHDLVFWFGDLNFRLDVDSFSTSEIVNLVSQNDLKPLLEKDELNETISSNKAFSGFSECKINFKPTYKFIPDSQEYDKKRRPAWTDRIIYKTFENSSEKQTQRKDSDQVLCKGYQSHSNFTVSDHKPVSAQFDIQVKGGLLDVVTFDPIKSWVDGTVGKIVVTLPSSIEISSWHWIAIYREEFSSLGEYVSYVWVTRQSLPDRSRSYEINVPEKSVRIPGKYIAAYMSDTHPYHIMGISSVFEVDESHLEYREL